MVQKSTLVGRAKTIRARRNDGSVWERELPFVKGFYPDVVAQLNAQLIEFPFCSALLFDGDQASVSYTQAELRCHGSERHNFEPVSDPPWRSVPWIL